MEKVKASDYAKFVAFFYINYAETIKKTGSVIAFNGKLYRNAFALKYEAIIQIKKEFSKENLEKDMSLVEMFKVVFGRKNIVTSYDMCYHNKY